MFPPFLFLVVHVSKLRTESSHFTNKLKVPLCLTIMRHVQTEGSSAAAVQAMDERQRRQTEMVVSGNRVLDMSPTERHSDDGFRCCSYDSVD